MISGRIEFQFVVSGNAIVSGKDKAIDASAVVFYIRLFFCSGGAMSEDVQIITVGSARYVIKVGILDLYPKPMSSILKHCKRADAVCEAYRRVVVQN